MSAGRKTDPVETDRDSANRAASGWAILLQEDPDDQAVRAQFAAWLDESPLHKDAWAETQRITHVIRTSPPAHAGRWRKSNFPILPFVRSTKRQRAGIAAAAAAACLAITVAPSMLVDLRADVTSGTGELRSIPLADGSTMILAPHSAAAFDVSKGGERKVQLLKGRAWFEVAPDRDHPFRVVAADTTTTVLGTAFEVTAEDQQVSVAVRHGMVRVACSDQPERAEQLAAGDELDLACDKSSAFRKTVDPIRIAAWTDHQVIASDRPVREVIDALKPWHTGLIIAYGEGLDTRRVTGAYDMRQADKVLHALAQSHDISVRNVTPWITVISAE